MRVKELLDKARAMRTTSAKTEACLWARLRNRSLAGFKFRRQHPIGRYIVDFVDLENKIVVEVDGGQHASSRTYDAVRDQWLSVEGYKVLRFWDNEVFMNLEGVLQTIRDALVTPHPALSPKGRGRKRTEAKT